MSSGVNGGGPNGGPNAYGGIKIGGSGFAVDLGYDRTRSRSGFAGEASGLLPVFRLPRPRKDDDRNYLRIYAEPGIGYRAGGGAGAYASAKAMVVLFSDERLTSESLKWSPFLEVQHRFFVQPGPPGDTRITIGLIWAMCEHCGFN